MIVVCAWCKKFLGTKGSEVAVAISHSICSTCLAIQKLKHQATLVVSRDRTDLMPVLKDVFARSSKILLVIDRREDVRRKFINETFEEPGEKRWSDDRRIDVSLFLH